MPLVFKRKIKEERLVIVTPGGETLSIWVETLAKNKNKVRIVLEQGRDVPHKFFRIVRGELFDA